jgi:hypothetical protein
MTSENFRISEVKAMKTPHTNPNKKLREPLLVCKQGENSREDN